MKIEYHTLNIYEWTKILCLEALNNSFTIREAAAKLGITERTLFNHIKDFGFVKGNPYEGKYQWYVAEKKTA